MLRKTIQAVALVLAASAVVMPAEAKSKRDYGEAPAGCRYGPRGGLHCDTVRAPRGPSVESQRREDARLRRECKGRPKAGACLGYN